MNADFDVFTPLFCSAKTSNWTQIDHLNAAKRDPRGSEIAFSFAYSSAKQFWPFRNSSSNAFARKNLSFGNAIGLFVPRDASTKSEKREKKNEH